MMSKIAINRCPSIGLSACINLEPNCGAASSESWISYCSIQAKRTRLPLAELFVNRSVLNVYQRFWHILQINSSCRLGYVSEAFFCFTVLAGWTVSMNFVMSVSSYGLRSTLPLQICTILSANLSRYTLRSPATSSLNAYLLIISVNMLVSRSEAIEGKSKSRLSSM